MATAITRMQRLSLYVCLLLSVACLAYADLSQGLVEMRLFYVVMFIALGGAYWAEGRWVLSNRFSNFLATFVVIGGALWIALQLQQSNFRSDTGLEMTRELVSHMGPVLGCLLLAKLFRPKISSDLWLLHLLGLVQVLLASVLAMSTRLDRDAPFFPLMLLAYLTSLVWAQRWFFMTREAESAASTSTSEMAHQWFSLKPLGWFLLTFVVAVVLFFSLPQGGLDLNFFQDTEHAETGVSQKIDLNAEGVIQISDEQVMRIWANNTVDKVQLPETVRFRGAVLSIYGDKSGEWKAPEHWMSNFLSYRLPVSARPLRPGMTRFDFDIDVNQVQDLGRTRGRGRDNTVPLFLPDPPSWDQTDRPYSMPNQKSHFLNPLMTMPMEGIAWLNLSGMPPNIHITYDYAGSLNAHEWDQRLGDPNGLITEQLKSLTKLPERVKQSGRILKTAQDALSQSNIPADASAKEKGRALESFLSSQQFTYTLSRPRQDFNIDPTEDFLCNVKEGHCERFASALAIMLRSVGVPARLVMGYRGADWNELGGFYVVRQLHAHAWVEALVDYQRDARGILTLKWQILDPSPVNDRNGSDTAALSQLSFARFLWEFFILDFSGQSHRARLMAQLQGTALGRFIIWWKSLNWWQSGLLATGLVLSLVGVIWLLLRLRRRWRVWWRGALSDKTPSVPFYARLLRLLSRRGWRPTASQTPQEFAASITPQLAGRGATAAVALVPEQVIPDYYAVRFGGKSLSPQAQTHLDQQLDSLQSALRR